MVNISTSGKSFYVIDDVVLCKGDFTTISPYSLFVVNKSNIQIDLNGSVISNTGLGNAIFSRYSGTIVKNGVLKNFGNAISIFDINENTRNVSWYYITNPSSLSDIYFSVSADQDNNYVVAGYDGSLGNNRFLVSKFSPKGTGIWNWTLNPSSGDDSLVYVDVDREGNYIAVGYDTIPGNNELRMVKISSEGELIWSWAQNPSSGSDRFAAVAVDNENNYIAVGIDNAPGNLEFRAVKISSSGSLIWSWTHNPSTTSDYLTSVAVDHDGNYVFAGYDNALGNMRWRVFKFSPSGTQIWNWTYNPSSGYDTLNSITVDQDNNYIAVGYDYTPGNAQWIVVKISPEGETLWVWKYNPSSGFDSLTNIKVDQDNNYLIAGYDYIPSTLEQSIIKVTSNGNLLWHWRNLMGVSSFLSSVAVDKEGNYVGSGYSSVSGNAELFLVKINTTKNALSGVKLYNMSIYDSNASTFISLANANAEISNVTYGYNQSVGIINYPSISSANGVLSNSRTVFLRPDFVSLDSDELPSMNTLSKVKLYVNDCASFTRTNLIYADNFHISKSTISSSGSTCPPSVCSNLKCSGGILLFDAASFSGYAYGGNANLIIYNNGPKYSNQTITFTANYSNSTDSSHISGATCILTLFNGSTYTMSESTNIYIRLINVTQPDDHTYNVTCSKLGFTTLTANDTFIVLDAFNGTPINLFHTNATNITNLERWKGDIISSNIKIEGGNISDLNLSSSILTDRWAALYGSITNEIYLTSAMGDITNYVYRWSWNAADGGVVCATTNSSLLSGSARGASGADIDFAWGFGSVSDSGSNTFRQPGCNITINNRNITNCYYADTGSAGGFVTCIIKTKLQPQKNNLLFCTNVNSTGTAFNGVPADFEIILPVAYGAGQLETYYLYFGLR
ncbi:MAG: hypothetical protein QW500_02695 [Candidatus Micrarchaeia archaeon]